MIRFIKVVFLLFIGFQSTAQELFVYSEPASNMPAKSLGVRVTNMLMYDKVAQTTNYLLSPELMWGANKNLMIHAEGYFNNMENNLDLKGGSVYSKYRFYTKDTKNRHFRMAAYGRASVNNGALHHQEAIETAGYNTGYEVGLITTQLLHKQALSASVSFEHALDNGKGNKLAEGQKDKAINYSLSTGRLILPKKYINYEQTNMNLMLELLGQSLPGSDKLYVDLAPSVQFIFNSQLRVDLGYRKQLYSNMFRSAPDGFLIRIEYLFFNLFPSK